MRNTIILLALFLFLGAGAYWYSTSEKVQQKSTVTASDRDFAVNRDEVHRVFIVQPDGETVDLKRQKDHWTYNDEGRANPLVIDGILDAASRLEVSYLVTNSLKEFVRKSLAGAAIKVELYDKEGDKLKAYYIGGESNDQEATYYLMEGSNTPYAVGLPGWAGVLRVRFAYKGDDWRDKMVFAKKPTEITEIICEYPKQKSQSFTLKKEGGSYTVEPFYETTPRNPEPALRGRVEGYLRGFKKLRAEAFANSFEGKDSIAQTVPFCNFTLKDSDGEVTEVQFFPIRSVNQQGQVITDGDTMMETSIERYYARYPKTNDFLMIQQRVFGEIFASYDSFFE